MFYLFFAIFGTERAQGGYSCETKALFLRPVTSEACNKEIRGLTNISRLDLGCQLSYLQLGLVFY